LTNPNFFWREVAARMEVKASEAQVSKRWRYLSELEERRGEVVSAGGGTWSAKECQALRVYVEGHTPWLFLSRQLRRCYDECVLQWRDLKRGVQPVPAPRTSAAQRKTSSGAALATKVRKGEVHSSSTPVVVARSERLPVAATQSEAEAPRSSKVIRWTPSKVGMLMLKKSILVDGIV
jgi:hypothetical protein